MQPIADAGNLHNWMSLLPNGSRSLKCSDLDRSDRLNSDDLASNFTVNPSDIYHYNSRSPQTYIRAATSESKSTLRSLYIPDSGSSDKARLSIAIASPRSAEH
ncbi:hypothetical protein [Chamaesiphon minutus]|uniref:hypothetical protein n=1 Tax=Chamaesiphon minutus TaxID=1173032 RepID=UPI000307AE08|nr:hypothetical protein [Chamaesiphon minutus]